MVEVKGKRVPARASFDGTGMCRPFVQLHICRLA